jgi:hypothetical protein
MGNNAFVRDSQRLKLMKKSIPIAVLTLGLGALAAGPAAQAADWDVGIAIGIPGIVAGPPVYYAPPPPPVVVVPEPAYVPGPPYYYYDKHYYKHAEKRWKKQQKKMWKEYRRGYGRDDD